MKSPPGRGAAIFSRAVRGSPGADARIALRPRRARLRSSPAARAGSGAPPASGWPRQAPRWPCTTARTPPPRPRSWPRSRRWAGARPPSAPISRARAIGPLLDEVAEFAGEARARRARQQRGHLPARSFESLTAEEWDRVFALNARAPFLVTQAALPLLRRAGGARVINIGTVMFHRGAPGALHYVASKGAVIGLTHALARELGPDGITVNCLVPSMVDTETANATSAPSVDAVVAEQVVPRYQQPDDLVGAILWLASRREAPSRPARPSWPRGVGSSSDGHHRRHRHGRNVHGSRRRRRRDGPLARRQGALESGQSRGRDRRLAGRRGLRPGRRELRRRRHDDRHQRGAHAPRRARRLPHDGRLPGRPAHPAHQPQVPLRLPLAQAHPARAPADSVGVKERMDEEGRVLEPIDLEALASALEQIVAERRRARGRRLLPLLVPQPRARAAPRGSCSRSASRSWRSRSRTRSRRSGASTSAARP